MLHQFGGGANKKLGQHFLIDQRALEVIVETADIHRGDRVLEVGPGLGVLTRELLDRGAEVTAIERDRRFVEYLSAVGAGSPRPPMGMGEVTSPLRLVQGDAATIHWHELVGLEPWKFVSNLPYSMTSLALRKALWTPNPATNIVVLVQREVAERAIANKKKTSLLSLMIALASSSARIVRRVPAGAFFPPPKVESAILQIIPMSLRDREQRWGVDPEKIMQIAKLGFAHPRKMLISNLKQMNVSEKIFKQAGLSLKIRAEDLSPDDWARLARSF